MLQNYIDACDEILKLVQPFEQFEIPKVLKDFKPKKDSKISNEIVDLLHDTDMRNGGIDIINFMLKEGYIIHYENEIIFILTDIGRIAKRKGGHAKYLDSLELDDTLKKQMIDVNKAVKRSYIVSKFTLIFIAISTITQIIQIVQKQKDKDIQELNQSLKANTHTIDSISSCLFDSICKWNQHQTKTDTPILSKDNK